MITQHDGASENTRCRGKFVMYMQGLPPFPEHIIPSGQMARYGMITPSESSTPPDPFASPCSQLADRQSRLVRNGVCQTTFI